MNDFTPHTAPSTLPEAVAESLARYRAHRMTPGATAVLTALLTVATARVEPAQGRRLLQLVGQALAAERPLAPCATLTEIEDHASTQLTELGLGWCRMREAEAWIEIAHCELPPLTGLPYLLEGLYEGWLQAAGADPALRALWQGSDAEPVPAARLRFGHPERIGPERIGPERDGE